MTVSGSVDAVDVAARTLTPWHNPHNDRAIARMFQALSDAVGDGGDVVLHRCDDGSWLAWQRPFDGYEFKPMNMTNGRRAIIDRATGASGADQHE